METARKLDLKTEAKPEGLAPSDIEFLKTTFLLKDVDDSLIQTVASFFEKVYYDRGEPIVLENEAGDDVYFIKSGRVEILKYLPAVKQVQRLALLTSPSHFSEFSVLNKGAKTGSAFAVESCELLRIKGDHFMALLRQIPEVASRLCAHIAHLLDITMRREAIEIFDPRQVHPSRELAALLPPPTWKKFNLLPLRLDRNFLRVAMLDPFQAGFMEALRATNPSLVVCVYLIGPQEYEAQLKRLTPLYAANAQFEGSKRAVEVEPMTDLQQLLRRSPLFNGLNDQTLNSLIPHFKGKSLQMGEAVFAPESSGDFLYVIQSGSIEFTKILQGSSVLLSLQKFSDGDHFGEENLIRSKNPCGYALATRPTTLYTLPKAAVIPLLADAEFCRGLCKSMIQKLQNRSSRAFFKYFDIKANPSFPKVIPLGIMTDHKVIDLNETEDEVTVGFVNADTENAYMVAGRYLIGKRIKLELLKETDFKRYLAIVQGPALAKLDTRPSDSKNSNHLEALLAIGYQDRASDIHFEPGDHALTVRYRIDGVLKEHNEKIPAAAAKEITSRLKVMSGMDISNHFLPQDGQLKITVGGENVIARASCIPTKIGEKMVLRLIRSKGAIIPYNMISPDRRLINILREVVGMRQGLFLITGPTGSGKSTTLYSMLQELNTVDSNCVTLEDPVEMNIPGITQVEVNEKTGLTFAKALRSVLRQDPDVIMVGEVRDEESAQIVFKAAITGHLVLSTLHTNSSLDVTPRLRELGVPPGTIATALIGVLAQRLVRGICRDCRDVRPVKIFEAKLFREHFPNATPPETLLEGRGCERCKGTGFYDRIPVFEIWKKTPEIKNLLAKDAGFTDLTVAARNDGFVSLMEFGLKLALTGLTTVDEVLRCISEE